MRAACSLLLLLAGPAQAGDCPPLDRLADGAATGALSAGAVTCLEQTVGAGSVADRLTASRLLIANAWGSGNRTDWSKHVQHHLEALDADDADLALRYGAHLMDHGAPSEGLKWAERALEHQYVWAEREDKADRLYEAHSLRTRAAQGTLAGLPENTPTLDKRALEGRIRLYAIEWLAHASRSELDPSVALAACESTGWDADRCKERASGLQP